MKEQAPVTVLDSTCLLGIHRLLKVIQPPFSRLVLPPHVKIVSWPSPIELLDFARWKHSDLPPFTHDSPLLQGKSRTQELLNEERQKVNDLLDKLTRFKLLETPDANDWSDDDEMANRLHAQPAHKQRPGLRMDVLIHLQREYVSLPLTTKEKMRIPYQDLEAVAFACGHHHDVASFNASVTDFLQPMGQLYVSEAQEFLPSSFESKTFDEYLRRVADGEANVESWTALCLKDNPVVSTVKTAAFTLASVASSLLGIPLDLATGAIQILNDMKRITGKSLIRIFSMFKINNEAAMVVEEMDHYFRSKPYREARED